eukprot:430478-Rhodomonas_salina.1
MPFPDWSQTPSPTSNDVRSGAEQEDDIDSSWHDVLMTEDEKRDTQDEGRNEKQGENASAGEGEVEGFVDWDTANDEGVQVLRQEEEALDGEKLALAWQEAVKEANLHTAAGDASDDRFASPSIMSLSPAETTDILPGFPYDQQRQEYFEEPRPDSR